MERTKSQGVLDRFLQQEVILKNCVGSVLRTGCEQLLEPLSIARPSFIIKKSLFHLWVHNLTLLRDGGNVGIGIVAPLRDLHITDTMRIEPRATAPSSPAAGDIYVDSTPAADELCFYDGTAWQGISSGTDSNCT